MNEIREIYKISIKLKVSVLQNVQVGFYQAYQWLCKKTWSRTQGPGDLTLIDQLGFLGRVVVSIAAAKFEVFCSLPSASRLFLTLSRRELSLWRVKSAGVSLSKMIEILSHRELKLYASEGVVKSFTCFRLEGVSTSIHFCRCCKY